MKEEQKAVLIKAIQKFGVSNQLDMVMEEAAELIQAVNKVKREKYSQESVMHLMGEMVDVTIMIEQLKIIFDLNIDWKIDEKITRLENRMKD